MKEEIGRTHGEGAFLWSPQRVSLDVGNTGETDGWTWKTRGLESARKSSQAGRPNVSGVAALSRRLMAVERARFLGKKPRETRVWAFELEAKMLAEATSKRQPGTSKSEAGATAP